MAAKEKGWQRLSAELEMTEHLDMELIKISTTTTVLRLEGLLCPFPSVPPAAIYDFSPSHLPLSAHSNLMNKNFEKRSGLYQDFSQLLNLSRMTYIFA